MSAEAYRVDRRATDRVVGDQPRLRARRGHRRGPELGVDAPAPPRGRLTMAPDVRTSTSGASYPLERRMISPQSRASHGSHHPAWGAVRGLPHPSARRARTRRRLTAPDRRVSFSPSDPPYTVMRDPQARRVAPTAWAGLGTPVSADAHVAARRWVRGGASSRELGTLRRDVSGQPHDPRHARDLRKPPTAGLCRGGAPLSETTDTDRTPRRVQSFDPAVKRAVGRPREASAGPTRSRRLRPAGEPGNAFGMVSTAPGLGERCCAAPFGLRRRQTR
jgi:hypothetical protein